MANKSRMTTFYTNCLVEDIRNGLFDDYGKLTSLQLEYTVPFNRNKHVDVYVETDKMSIAIEVKKGKYDFKTRCGENFIGDINFFCVPSELVGFAIRYIAENYDANCGIKVIEIDECGRCFRMPCCYAVDDLTKVE